MEFSCHTWGFNDLTLPEALGTIARLGFRYVDIGTGPHLNAARAASRSTKKAILDALREDLKTFNLKVADLYIALPRISVDDEEKRAADIAVFKALMPFAQGIGSAGVTLTSGLVHPGADTAAHDRMVDALKEMLVAAHQADVPLSIEPHLDSMVQTPDEALALVKAVPGLQITLDWAQMICQDVRHEDIITLLPHTRHVQVRQAARAQLQLPFERGRLRIPDIMNALHAADYGGTICVEYMQTVGWHGMEAVNSIIECRKLRDALRTERDQPTTA